MMLGSLSAEATRFIGRERELGRLAKLLAQSRMVTIVGPGGVGKTRVALRAAAGHSQDAVLVELSGLRDPVLLAHTVASALGLPGQDGRSRTEAIAGYLRDRSLLLILDTCEHLVDECALLADTVLSGAPQVRILATSRQPLNAPGENTLRLDPLPVPEPGASPAPGDAVGLFAERAAAAVPGFAITEQNQEDAVRVCRFLDGMPLALELAAVRLRALPLEELADRMRHPGQFLGTRRCRDDRHRALGNSIRWSYDLCTPAERALWARLSVFAGDVSLTAAEEVCGDLDAAGTLPREFVIYGLMSLVEKSVLVRTADTRYRMLATIREFGAERLAEARSPAGEERETAPGEFRRALLEHYASRAAELGADPLTDQVASVRALRAEHDNIRAALDYGLEAPGAEHAAARLMTSLYWYWALTGEIQEARHWLARGLARITRPSPERARLLSLHAVTVAVLSDPADAIAGCADGLEMSRELGEPGDCARAHLYYFHVLLMAGRSAEAEAVARTATDLLTASGDTGSLVQIDLYLGVWHLLSGRLEACLAACERGLARIAPGSGECWASSFLHGLTGLVLFLRGQAGQGASTLRRALDLRRELGDPLGIAYGLHLLGFMAAGQHRFRRAAVLLGAASALWERLGTRFLGFPGLDDLARPAAERIRGELGDTVYDSLFRAAATRPVDEILTLAIDDADEMAPLKIPRARGAAGDALVPLTRREREIAGLAAGGMSNRDIAERLFISKRTVDSHLEHIYAKLGVSSRVRLAAMMPADGSAPAVSPP